MTTSDAPGAVATASAGFTGELQVRVFRANPTLRQRLLDWLRSLRRF